MKHFADLTEKQYKLPQFIRNRICSLHLLSNVTFKHSRLISLVCSIFFSSLSNLYQISDTLRKAYTWLRCPVVVLLQAGSLCKGKEDYNRKLSPPTKTFWNFYFLKGSLAVFPVFIFIALWTWCERNGKYFRGKISVLSTTSTMNCLLETIYLIAHLAYIASCGSTALLLNMSFLLKSYVRINMKSSL